MIATLPQLAILKKVFKDVLFSLNEFLASANFIFEETIACLEKV